MTVFFAPTFLALSARHDPIKVGVSTRQPLGRHLRSTERPETRLEHVSDVNPARRGSWIPLLKFFEKGHYFQPYQVSEGPASSECTIAAAVRASMTRLS